jgi:hypothetical protein
MIEGELENLRRCRALDFLKIVDDILFGDFGLLN